MSEAQVSIGIRTGINISDVKFADKNINKVFKDFTNKRISVNDGIIFETYIFQNMALQQELIFSPKGYKYSESLAKGYHKYWYLQFNSTAKFENNIDLSNKYYILIAPYFAYWLRGVMYYKDYKNVQTFKEKIKFSYQINNYGEITEYKYNRFEYGFLIAAGLKHEMDNEDNIFLEIRYEHGFNNNGILNIDATINKVFSINCGYLF